MTKKPVKKKKVLAKVLKENLPYSVKISMPEGANTATSFPLMALPNNIIWEFESTEDRDTMLKTLSQYKQVEFHGSTKIANLDVNLETGIVRVQTSKILSL